MMTGQHNGPEGKMNRLGIVEYTHYHHAIYVDGYRLGDLHKDHDGTWSVHHREAVVGSSLGYVRAIAALRRAAGI